MLEWSGEEVEGRSPLFNSVSNKPPLSLSILIPSIASFSPFSADTDQAFPLALSSPGGFGRKVGSKQDLQEVHSESVPSCSTRLMGQGQGTLSWS